MGRGNGEGENTGGRRGKGISHWVRTSERGGRGVNHHGGRRGGAWWGGPREQFCQRGTNMMEINGLLSHKIWPSCVKGRESEGGGGGGVVVVVSALKVAHYHYGERGKEREGINTETGRRVSNHGERQTSQGVCQMNGENLRHETARRQGEKLLN